MRSWWLLGVLCACRTQGALPSDKVEGSACAAPAQGQATVQITRGLDEGLSQAIYARHGSLGDDELDPEITIAEHIDVVAGCGRTFSTPSFTIRIPRLQIAIGKHDIAQSKASAVLRAGVADEVRAKSGSVTLTGYDPATDSLCGEATLEFPDRTLTATFLARAFCD